MHRATYRAVCEVNELQKTENIKRKKNERKLTEERRLEKLRKTGEKREKKIFFSLHRQKLENEE